MQSSPTLRLFVEIYFCTVVARECLYKCLSLPTPSVWCAWLPQVVKDSVGELASQVNTPIRTSFNAWCVTACSQTRLCAGLFEVKDVSPPPRTLGIHSLPPDTHNGDQIEVEGQVCVALCTPLLNSVFKSCAAQHVLPAGLCGGQCNSPLQACRRQISA